MKKAASWKFISNWNALFKRTHSCSDPENFVRGGPFFFYQGAEKPTNTKTGPSLVNQGNAISLAGWLWPKIECWLGSFVIFQGIWIPISIVKKNYIFVIFRGGGGSRPPVPTPLWICAWHFNHLWTSFIFNRERLQEEKNIISSRKKILKKDSKYFISDSIFKLKIWLLIFPDCFKLANNVENYFLVIRYFWRSD